jgi:hypothetical protein
MHTDVQGVCNKYQDLLEIIVSYVSAKLKLDLNIASEKELANRLQKLDSNSAMPKDLARSAAHAVFLDLSNNLKSFAWNKGDMKLYLEVKFTDSSLKKVSDSEFVRICENLLTVAQDNLPQLADRNITAQTLTADSALLANFVAEKQLFVDTRREHYEASEQLTKQIKTTNFDLKSIDGIFESIEASRPLVASDYWKARNIPKPIGSKIVMKGKVYDSATNQPMPGAMLSLVRIYNNKSMTASSDLAKNVKIKSAGGGFQLKSLPTGTYLITVTYAGYADQQVTAYVNDGVLTVVQLPLSKLPE